MAAKIWAIKAGSRFLGFALWKSQNRPEAQIFQTALNLAVSTTLPSPANP
jgi:hypothetical protein